MTEFALTRKQVLQLADLAAKFPKATWFSLESESKNDIGESVTVKFTMFDPAKDFDTTVNITDSTVW